MKEVIEEILQEEKEARHRVETAREEAKKIRLNAEAMSKKILAEAQSEAGIESKKILNQAKENAENERIQKLSDAEKASGSLWEEKADLINQTISDLVDMIISRFQTQK